MKKDFYFPGYHFRPEKNWMNDPNGLIWKDGWYHLFFQYNPEDDIWGNIHWGHARSRNLIHWEMCPIALAPSNSEGEIHCYSGCAVEYQGNVKLFYTSIGEGKRGPENGAEQWAAVNEDEELIRWKKCKEPALKQEINAGNVISMWRDPFIWKEDSVYRLLLSGTCEGKGCIALYESADLDTWQFRSILYRSEKYELIECPNIMKFGERYVLLYSPLEAVHYVIGRINPDTLEFQAESEGIFDYSVGKKGFYAPNTYLNDPEGRYLVMGCLFEGDRLEAKRKRGWAGMQSLPREVTFQKGKLCIHPASECRILRKEILNVMCKETKKISAFGNQLELELFYRPSVDTVVKITLLASENGDEKTVLVLDYARGQIYLNRRASTLYDDIATDDIMAPLCLSDGEVSIDIFVDHSAIEVFYNNEITLSARVFTKKETSVYNEAVISGKTEISKGTIYKLEV